MIRRTMVINKEDGQCCGYFGENQAEVDLMLKMINVGAVVRSEQVEKNGCIINKVYVQFPKNKNLLTNL